MKFFILFCCIVVVVYAETQKEYVTYVKTAFLKAVDNCKQTLTTVPKVECLLFCLVQDLKMMKVDGTVDKATLLEITDRINKFSPEISTKVQAAFDTCIAKVKKVDDPCAYATDLHHCYAEEKESKGIPDVFRSHRNRPIKIPGLRNL